MASKRRRSRQRARQKAVGQGKRAAVPPQGEPSKAEPDAPSDPQPGTKKAERLERREAAREARLQAAKQKLRQRRLRQLLIGVVVLVVVGGGTVFLVQRQNRASIAVATEAEAAGCSDIQTFEDAGQTHVDAPGAERTPYNSNPPTSGDHFGTGAPVNTGTYQDTLDPELWLHNLEHGQTVVHYKDLDIEDISKIEDLTDQFPEALVVMPNDEIDDPVVLTSWRHMQSCQKVAPRVISSFVKARCNKSPEPVSNC